MVDLETAHLQAFQAVTCGQGAGGHTFGLGLTEHALCFQIAPHRRIGWHLDTVTHFGDAQIVKVKLNGPAGMLTILLRQNGDYFWRKAWKAADVTTQSVLEGSHRIVGMASRVEPAFQGGHTEGDIKPGNGMTPSLGGE